MFDNLLDQALSVIPKQSFTYIKFKSRTISDNGLMVNTYENAQTYEGSVQAVDSKMYEQLGLDKAKKYIQVFSSLYIKNVASQVAPDRIGWNGKLYEVVDCTDWYNQDGWTNIIAVEIKNA